MVWLRILTTCYQRGDRIRKKAPDTILESKGVRNPEMTASVLEPDALTTIEAIANTASPQIENLIEKIVERISREYRSSYD